MEPIDWRTLASGGLWIGGLSVALAAWSYAFWSSRDRRDRNLPLRQVLARPGFQIAFNAGLGCFALGLAGSAPASWERLAWLGLAVTFGWQVAAGLRSRRSAGAVPHSTGSKEEIP